MVVGRRETVSSGTSSITFSDTDGHGDDGSTSTTNKSAQSEEDEPDEEVKTIAWINIIFLPFLSWWKILMLIIVCTKCFFGPVSAVYPSIRCSTKEYNLENAFEVWVFFYTFGTDALYIIDIFFCIIHRQVTEEAMKRQYLPKAGFYIILDIISVVPFFSLLSDDLCKTEVMLWPNFAAFTELVIMYRIGKYFHLSKTHSAFKLICGYWIIFMLTVNALTCFLMLMTAEGLCERCDEGFYDWRSYKWSKNDTVSDAMVLMYGTNYIVSVLIHFMFDEVKPSTYREFLLFIVLAELGFIVKTFILKPKIFAEKCLRYVKIYQYQHRVERILSHLIVRNSESYKDVKHFYNTMWYKESGITNIPESVHELPHNLRVDIRLDLAWPVFWHSPTFRNTSRSYKRWLSDYVVVHHKLPGDAFFAGLHCFSHLYYIKYGIVQLLSSDDSAVPTISVTSGTIFGDTSFYTPPINRNIYSRCLTYCKVLSLSRADILRSLHLFPKDRAHIMKMAQYRLKHGRELYAIKKSLGKLVDEGSNRTEGEGIAWLKRRWWEISDLVNNWKTSRSRRSCVIPPEDDSYHCPKFIGQLVLCKDVLYKKKSVFVRTSFPWILVKHSKFGRFWNNIVITTVYMTILLLPPIVLEVELKHIKWFDEFLFTVDTVYVMDIIVTVLTAKEGKEYEEINILATIVDRFKEKSFVLDVLSTPIFDIFTIYFMPDYEKLGIFNRLFKTYILFYDRYRISWHQDHLIKVGTKCFLGMFCVLYISPYFVFLLSEISDQVTEGYFFGDICKESLNHTHCEFKSAEFEMIGIFYQWITSLILYRHTANAKANSLTDLMLESSIMVAYIAFFIYLEITIISALYSRHRFEADFQYLAKKWLTIYQRNNLRPVLLQRLHRHLFLHWRLNKGLDFMTPTELRNEEPYDVYFKAHGELAEQVIGNSAAFRGAEQALIKELAHKSRIRVLPKRCLLVGVDVFAEEVYYLLRGEAVYDYFTQGKFFRRYLEPGEIIAPPTVFLGHISMTNFYAATDCEVLSISIQEFVKVIQHYPEEWGYFQNCITEFGPAFDKTSKEILKNHAENHIVMTHELLMDDWDPTTPPEKKGRLRKILNFFKEYRRDPESKFIRYWIGIRAGTYFINIFLAGLRGGLGILYYNEIGYARNVCDAVHLLDIILRLFLPYYNESGLIISDIRMCIVHYITRSFIVDVVSLLARSHTILKTLVGAEHKTVRVYISHICLGLGLYNLWGFLNYHTDAPSSRACLLTLIKWQISTFLILGDVGYLFLWDCVHFRWDDDGTPHIKQVKDTCWLPMYFEWTQKTLEKVYAMHFTYAQGLTMVYGGFFMNPIGYINFEPNIPRFASIFIVLTTYFTYQRWASSVALLLYYRRGYGVKQGANHLRNFLKDERIDANTIDRSIKQLNHWSRRSIAIHKEVLFRNIGAVLRQDLNYFFFKRTLENLDTILNGGSSMRHQLAGNCYPTYLIDDQDVVREMQLTDEVFIVHRGKVVVLKNDKKIATLTKGAIFGILDSATSRPMSVTVRTVGCADVLQVSCSMFQAIINNKIRQTIAEHPQAKLDFLPLKTPIRENPYNTIEYLTRDKKVIKLPKMKKPMSAHQNTWYNVWLLWAWVINPVLIAGLVQVLSVTPAEERSILKVFIYILDVFHILYLVSECFTMELMVEEKKCVMRYLKWAKLKEWWLYIDVISIIVPFFFFDKRTSKLVRLLRIYSVYFFNRYFCNDLSSVRSRRILKFIMILILLHTLTCGWIFVECKSWKKFPVANHLSELPDHLAQRIDPDEWVNPMKRVRGCPRGFPFKVDNVTEKTAFLVPRDLTADYLVALTYITVLHTHTNMDCIYPLQMYSTYYRVFAQHIMYLVELWLTCVAISAGYGRLRIMYHYDFRVYDLITYLRMNGVCKFLLQYVSTYMTVLWRRNQGSQIPEIVKFVPKCLREDIYSALYMYHLQTPSLFQGMPEYFLRQMVVKLKRTVVYPGKYIVQQGDIHPCLYFIHEGEVEKSYIDNSGENRLASILQINGYFGIMSCLFPETPYSFSYFSRTIVDVVALHHEDWQELLGRYPAVRDKLYRQALREKRKPL